MKKLIRNSLIAFVVAVAGAAGFAGEAKANPVNVDFSTEVPNTCEITKLADGIIGVGDTNPNSLSSKPDESTGAQLGSVEVNCNGSGTISVTDPVAASPDAQALFDSGTNSGAELHTDSDGSNMLTTSSTTIAPNGTPQTLYVHVWTNRSEDPVPEGNYTLRSTVTIAPQ